MGARHRRKTYKSKDTIQKTDYRRVTRIPQKWMLGLVLYLSNEIILLLILSNTARPEQVMSEVNLQVSYIFILTEVAVA